MEAVPVKFVPRGFGETERRDWWWIEAIIGVLILARWLPGSGRHAAPATDDSWAQGPSLSILGHVGMVLGVAFFTFCVVTGRVV